jgi:hypothetical protein
MRRKLSGYINTTQSRAVSISKHWEEHYIMINIHPPRKNSDPKCACNKQLELLCEDKLTTERRKANSQW